MKRGSWTTRFGFYLMAVGSACGLGNLWRFPYVVGENGGGAFVLLYILLALVLGLPLLIGELMLGKSTGKSLLMANYSLDHAQNKNLFRWISRLAIIMTLIVLSYYAIISGWVLYYGTQFFVAFFKPDHLSGTSGLQFLDQHKSLQIGLGSVHLLLLAVVVIKGVQEGLERWIGGILSFFAILMVILISKSLSLPTASDALRFLFYPDFAKLNWSSLAQAIGHVFFTLSVGFGTMVTFGSYMKRDEHIPTAGYRVTLMDTLLSLFSGLLIFPIALQASNIPLTDPGLLFEALPKFLITQRSGVLFGFLFFVFLYLAAFGASLGLLEVVVSNLVDRTKIKRPTAVSAIAVIALVIGMVPALIGRNKTGKGALEMVDAIIINWFLPMIALGVCVAISQGMKTKEKEKLFVDQNKIESSILFSHWQFIIRWFAPIIIITGLVFQIVGLIV